MIIDNVNNVNINNIHIAVVKYTFGMFGNNENKMTRVRIYQKKKLLKSCLQNTCQQGISPKYCKNIVKSQH